MSNHCQNVTLRAGIEEKNQPMDVRTLSTPRELTWALITTCISNNLDTENKRSQHTPQQ